MLFLAAPKDPPQTAWCIYNSCGCVRSGAGGEVAKGWHESSVNWGACDWLVVLELGWSGSQGEVFDFVAAPLREASFLFSQDAVLPVLEAGAVSEVVGIMQPLGRSCLPCAARLSTGQRYTNALFRRGASTRARILTHARTPTQIRRVTVDCFRCVHFGFTSRLI